MQQHSLGHVIAILLAISPSRAALIASFSYLSYISSSGTLVLPDPGGRDDVEKLTNLLTSISSMGYIGMGYGCLSRHSWK